MKAIWKGAIGFGLVNIPVKLYNATHDSELELSMLDKDDLSNIRYQRINEKTGKEVPWENIVKGYKLDDKYIVLNEEDFEKASPQKNKLIQISGFVDAAEIEPMFYENAYYLEPDQTGTRAYALLRDALAQTGKAGIASFILKTKESLAVLHPKDDVIILNRIRYQQEILETEGLNLPKQKENTKEEMDMAVKLITQFSSPFHIGKYKDTYSDALLKMIKTKAAGNKPKQPRMKIVRQEEGDLVAQLKASLAEKKMAS